MLQHYSQPNSPGLLRDTVALAVWLDALAPVKLTDARVADAGMPADPGLPATPVAPQPLLALVDAYCR